MINYKQIKTKKELYEWAIEKRKRLNKKMENEFNENYSELQKIEQMMDKKLKELKC